ncbi:hypothetical protein [Defluviimonas sp. SAOS-178_SWC]|uniref:hypothetical protein n=1 Tax=Defluviimonas sp. SAOS-178_SWC TaxID=3121287 RepID=UPI003221D0B5
MLIGFFLRRVVTLTLCAGAFWLGLKADQLITVKPAAATVAADCPEAADGN